MIYASSPVLPTPRLINAFKDVPLYLQLLSLIQSPQLAIIVSMDVPLSLQLLYPIQSPQLAIIVSLVAPL
jgi:hypothetical protein